MKSFQIVIFDVYFVLLSFFNEFIQGKIFLSNIIDLYY